jgi:hypothetical protein
MYVVPRDSLMKHKLQQEQQQQQLKVHRQQNYDQYKTRKFPISMEFYVSRGLQRREKCERVRVRARRRGRGLRVAKSAVWPLHVNC